MNIDDPILTAYALGEPLSPEETAAVERFLAQSPEARAFVEETRAFAALLKGEFQEELKAELPVKASVVPMPAPPKGSRAPVLWWSAAAAVVGLGAIFAISLPPMGAVKVVEVAPATREEAGEAVAKHASGLSDADIAAIATAAEKTAETLGEQPAGHEVQIASAPQDSSFTMPTMAPPPPVAPTPEVGRNASGQSAQSDIVTTCPGPNQVLNAKMGVRIDEFESAWGNARGSRLERAPVMSDARNMTRSRLLQQVDKSWELHPREYGSPAPAGEGYTALPENAFTETAAAPLSTFSLDVDTASYANVRRLLRQGTLPPAGAVRLEEMVNYFDYDDPTPTGSAPFAVTLQSAEAPWAPAHRLVRIAVKARDVEREQIKGVNLVFLIDTSGSMRSEEKLPLVQKSLRYLLDQLGKDDRVAIVTYAGTSQTALESTPVSEREKILAVIDGLVASGGTNGAGGLEKAYAKARAGFIQGGVNRVILATDGDFNIGMTQNADLEEAIAAEARSGVTLTVLGFGMGDYQDSRMKLLSTKGAGNYAYIDSEAEAQRVLVEQMRGTLVTVAKDVKVQVEFNPAKVQSYRLLGYENRLMAKEDFNNDQKDAGDIGAGHHVTALYEMVPVGVAPQVDPLKYAPAADTPKPPAVESDEWLTVKIRTKAPEGDASERLEFPYTDRGATLEKSSNDFRFTAAVAQFSQLLTRSANAGNASWESTLSLAEGALGEDHYGRRAEFLTLVARARELSEGASGNGWKR